MQCHLATEKIVLLLDNELGGSEQAALEEHLTTCVSCQQEMAEMQTLQHMLRAPLPELKPSPHFETTFWQKVAERQKTSQPWGWLKTLEAFFPIPSFTQAMALLLISLLIGGMGGIVSAANRLESVQAASNAPLSLSRFPEYKGLPHPSISATYMKKIERKAP